MEIEFDKLPFEAQFEILRIAAKHNPRLVMMPWFMNWASDNAVTIMKIAMKDREA